MALEAVRTEQAWREKRATGRGVKPLQAQEEKTAAEEAPQRERAFLAAEASHLEKKLGRLRSAPLSGRTEDKSAAPGGRGGLLKAIREGKKLKEASSRWEAEEEFLLRKQAVEEQRRRLEEALLAVDYGPQGIGMRVPVCRTVPVLRDWKRKLKENLVKLPQMLKVSKHCYLDATLELVLKIDVEKCRKLLDASGLKSLGLTAAGELVQLVATLLTLLCILLMDAKDAQNVDDQGHEEAVERLKALLAGKEFPSPLASSPGLGGFKPGSSDLATSLPANLRDVNATIAWCQLVNSRHPLACSSLELASDWPTFCGKVLGVI